MEQDAGAERGVTGLVEASTALHPSQVHVLRIRTAISVAALLVMSLILDGALAGDWVLPRLAVPGIVAVLGLLAILILPGRRYRTWAYGFSDEELHLRYGQLVRTRTLVPFARVQHIDVAQGPIQRPFGLATLVLHTAGTAGATVSLPGLKQGRAEEMRDLIRRQIRLEPE